MGLWFILYTLHFSVHCELSTLTFIASIIKIKVIINVTHSHSVWKLLWDVYNWQTVPTSRWSHHQIRQTLGIVTWQHQFVTKSNLSSQKREFRWGNALLHRGCPLRPFPVAPSSGWACPRLGGRSQSRRSCCPAQLCAPETDFPAACPEGRRSSWPGGRSPHTQGRKELGLWRPSSWASLPICQRTSREGLWAAHGIRCRKAFVWKRWSGRVTGPAPHVWGEGKGWLKS